MLCISINFDSAKKQIISINIKFISKYREIKKTNQQSFASINFLQVYFFSTLQQSLIKYLKLNPKYIYQILLMQIRTIYEINYKIGQLGGTSSPRQYIDIKRKSKSKSITIKHQRRETYIDDVQKLSKQIPGPGKYLPNPEIDKKRQAANKDRFRLLNKGSKFSLNVIEQLIKKKKINPGVGKYNLQVDKTQEIRQWHAILCKKERKLTTIFKRSIFDDCNIDCIEVDPASYVNLKPLGSKKIKQGIITQYKLPIQSTSMIKLPSPQTYHPIPSNYSTFARRLSVSLKLKAEDTIKRPIFYKYKNDISYTSPSPGPKYSLIAKWSSKDKSQPLQNIFKSTRNLAPISIYH